MQVVGSWSNEKCLPPRSIGHEFKYGNQPMHMILETMVSINYLSRTIQKGNLCV